MNRQPKAVGPRAVRRPFVALLGLVFVATALIPTSALAREPGQFHFGRPYTADAAELARTAPEAILAGTTNQQCTGWRSTSTPPPTIRVLRTVGPTRGTVEEVDFRLYVERVMPGEWPAYYPIEAMKAGAMQVKNYGWYFTVVYRGGKNAAGECYDVRDNTADQTYQPQKRQVYRIHRTAVRMTWGQNLRKFHSNTGKSTFFLAEYRTGSSTVCGADADGLRLYQRSILRCGRKVGMTYEQILRLYLTPKLEIVEPSLHDIVAEEAGDAAALVRGDADERTPRIFTPVLPDGLSPAGPAAPTLGSDFFAARAVDVDTALHSRDDLMSLHAPAAGGWRLSLSRSDGTGYGDSTTWWESSGSTPLSPDAQLVVGDFDGDSWNDTGIVVPGSEAGTATLRLVRTTKSGETSPANTIGTANAPIDWWTGPLDLATSRVWGADVDGDGRADLVAAHDLGAAGAEVLVAASLQPRGGGLGAPVAWYTVAELHNDTTRYAVGDVNRDGRDDIWLMTPEGAPEDEGISISALRANSTSTFTRIARWSSAPSDDLTWDGTKMGAGDLLRPPPSEPGFTDPNADGIGDLVLFVDRGAEGTRLVTLRGGYTSMVMGTVLDEPSLDWSRTVPY